LEEKIVEDGKSLGSLTLAEMDAVWDQVKVEETED
jgi:uncharacterized protein YabN with tetrapyrrole methylase and pyrophosphatase domain